MMVESHAGGRSHHALLSSDAQMGKGMIVMCGSSLWRLSQVLAEGLAEILAWEECMTGASLEAELAE